MARLRKGVAYRRMDARPYTRISKYRSKSFIRARPHIKVVKYEMGNLKENFRYRVYLKTNETIQLRHNSLEAARQAINRSIEKNVGKGLYVLKLRVFPHHILRENPLASGAGADRLSTGMKNSFGKSIGTAARVKKGQIIFEAGVNTLAQAELAKKALKKGSTKLPKGFKTDIVDTLKESKKPKNKSNTNSKNQTKTVLLNKETKTENKKEIIKKEVTDTNIDNKQAESVV